MMATLTGMKIILARKWEPEEGKKSLLLDGHLVVDSAILHQPQGTRVNLDSRILP